MDYKAMCIQQGYVPSTCLLDGELAWAMINEGEDPCKGCNHNRSKCNGRHAPYEDSDYGLMCFLDRWGEAERKEREEREKRYRELVRQRKEGHIKGYTRTLLEVRWDRGHSFDWEINIVTKDIVDEKAYYVSCNNIPDALHFIQSCCYKYKVEQIHIEDIGFGKSLYDAIVEMELPNVDIVPMKYIRMKM